MFDIFKIFFFFIVGFPLVSWWISSLGGWQELAEKYKTEQRVPDAFYIEENQRIIFKHETKNGSTALGRLGIGVSDSGLYLTSPSIPFTPDSIFPPLLIPWTDISYRKNTRNSSSSETFTFYLGNPRITRFSLNIAAIEILEADYGSAIFSNKLGEPD